MTNPKFSNLLKQSEHHISITDRVRAMWTHQLTINLHFKLN